MPRAGAWRVCCLPLHLICPPKVRWKRGNPHSIHRPSHGLETKPLGHRALPSLPRAPEAAPRRSAHLQRRPLGEGPFPKTTGVVHLRLSGGRGRSSLHGWPLCLPSLQRLPPGNSLFHVSYRTPMVPKPSHQRREQKPAINFSKSLHRKAKVPFPSCT